MGQTYESNRTRILALLRSIPQPGRILLDSVGEGASGFSLRPKSIPQRIIGTAPDSPWTVELQLMKEDIVIGKDRSFELDLRSDEWEKWLDKKPKFLIRTEDVGKGIDVVEERVKNFNRNLLHRFLDQLSITVTISKENRERVLHDDNYPFYFWDKPVAVSGTASSNKLLLIEAEIAGLEHHPAIKRTRNGLQLEYWDFLTSKDKALMSTVLGWHKALIALCHLMKRDFVNIPINFAEMEQSCRGAIESMSEFIAKL